MESSFLEDLLTREVDQSQVNALVGSLENQLTTSRSSTLPTKTDAVSTAEQITSLSRLVSQSTPKFTGKTQQNLVINRNTSSPVVSTQLNGNIAHNNKGSSTKTALSTATLSPNNVIIRNPIPSTTPSHNHSSSPRLNPSERQVSNSPRPMTPIRHVTGVSIAASPSSQVSIAPKITNTVPIAPRPGGANIMITPRQAQLLMAQRFGPGAALIPNNLIARMPGAIPVMPRIAGGIPVPPVINTQIPGIRTIGARPPNILSITHKNDPRMRLNSPLVTSLTQVPKSTNNGIPGQVNYRFRQVTPATAVTQQVTNGISASANTAANITMMKESVKRLKEFFQNLINLACGPNQPPEIGKMVKELVHNLMQNRVSEEEFIEKLQKTLKSDPQPNLVHFLKKTLPHLRETIKKQQMQQMQPKGLTTINRPQMRPSMPSTGLTRPSILTRTPRHITPQQILTNKVLSMQDQVLQKHLAQSRVIATSGQVTPGMKTHIAGPMHGIAAGKVHGLLQNSINAAKDKPRNMHYSSAVGGDEDFNDVTTMAGVNLMEESQNILATGADFMSYQTRNVEDRPILILESLKKIVDRIAKKNGLTDVGPEVLTILSHATEERLRSLLERLTACSLHRNNPHKDDVRYETISDVRNQLRVFEEIDEVERKHRESREREILMRAAKSRSRTEDPEQARLKEKAKQMQLEEEEINRKRAANRTALEAIGGPRKKRKLDEALESLNAQTPGGGSSTSTPSNSGTHNSQTNRTRQHRVTFKDLLFVLESDRGSSKSLILYRSYVNR